MQKNHFFNCLVIVCIATLFASCKGSVGGTAGIKKDFGTGLSSTYKNMEPEIFFFSNE